MKKKYLAIAVVLSMGMFSCVTEGPEDKAAADTKVENTDHKTEDVADTTPAEETTTEEVASTESSADYSAGEEIYNSTCKACHQPEGKGIPTVFPPLASSDFLVADKNRAIKIVLEGLSEEITVNGTTYNGVMTPQSLEDQQIVDVLNFVLNSWGNAGGEITLEDVQAQKGGE